MLRIDVTISSIKCLIINLPITNVGNRVNDTPAEQTLLEQTYSNIAEPETWPRNTSSLQLKREKNV